MTKQKLENRWRKGNGYKTKNPTHFYNAIQKYGWDNFQHEIIASNLTKEEAENFEILLISKLETTNEDKGYNIANGGNCVGTVSEKTKKKLSEIKKGKYMGELNPNYGNGDKMRGKSNPASRKVICITTNKIFDTTVDGAKYYGLDRTNVKSCCSKKTYTSGSNIGIRLKWMYYDEYLKYGDTTQEPPERCIKVICLNNDLIFNSVSKASDYFNTSVGIISNCCSLNSTYIIKDRIKYRFMYYDDYLKYGKFDFSDEKKIYKVICITNGNIYKSALNATKDYPVEYQTLMRECRKFHFKGENLPIKNKETGEETTWMYYEDYLVQNNK